MFGQGFDSPQLHIMYHMEGIFICYYFLRFTETINKGNYLVIQICVFFLFFELSFFLEFCLLNTLSTKICNPPYNEADLHLIGG